MGQNRATAPRDTEVALNARFHANRGPRGVTSRFLAILWSKLAEIGLEKANFYEKLTLLGQI